MVSLISIFWTYYCHLLNSSQITLNNLVPYKSSFSEQFLDKYWSWLCIHNGEILHRLRSLAFPWGKTYTWNLNKILFKIVYRYWCNITKQCACSELQENLQEPCNSAAEGRPGYHKGSVLLFTGKVASPIAGRIKSSKFNPRASWM